MNWSARLDELLLAAGWSQRVAAAKFDCSESVITRVLRGEMPKSRVKFLLRLKELEAAYANDIEALRAGAIVKFGKLRCTRVDFRRPQNSAQMGTGGTVGEDVRFGNGDSAPRAPRVVYLSAEGRRRLAKAEKIAARRSKANGGGTQ